VSLKCDDDAEASTPTRDDYWYLPVMIEESLVKTPPEDNPWLSPWPRTAEGSPTPLAGGRGPVMDVSRDLHDLPFRGISSR
jgi:hypothetical protein